MKLIPGVFPLHSSTLHAKPLESRQKSVRRSSFTSLMSSSGNPSRLLYGKGASQFVILRRPVQPCQSGKYPLAIILHGGFWKGKYGLDPPTSAIETISPSLLACGIMTAEVEYRRSGDAHWGYQYTDADVTEAYSACLALPEIDAARIVVIGHSAGGMLALSLLLKQDKGPQRSLVKPVLVLALAPVADLCRAAELRLSDDGDAVQQFMRGSPAERPEAYALACPACRAHELIPQRVVLVTGTNDKDVPPEYVRDFYEAVKHAHPAPSTLNLELVEIENTDHFDVVSATSNAWPLILAYIHDALRLGSHLSATKA